MYPSVVRFMFYVKEWQKAPAFPTPHTYVHNCSNVFFFLLFFYTMWIAIVNGCGNVSH